MADKYADRITAALNDFLLAKQSVVFNEYNYKGFRSDVLELNTDFEVIEYEIKTSVGDYKNDFLKKNRDGDNKHILIQDGELNNKFYFVFPPHLIPEYDVPEYCGILHFTGETFIEIREAILLCETEITACHQEEMLNAIKLSENKNYLLKYFIWRSIFYKQMYENMNEVSNKWYKIVRDIRKIVLPKEEL
jgi:hypothetical protein